MEFTCSACGRSYPPTTTLWRCPCGGYFNLRNPKPFAHHRIHRGTFSLWRYRESLPEVGEIVSMGEGLTPLVEAEWRGMPLHFKLEYLSPTGSFKDRGTAVLVSFLKSAGIKEVVEDSSGNAGASLAAYAARAGIKARIFVPAHASPAKKAQIAIYGAELVEVKGPREEAARAVWEEAEKGYYYASHYYNPLILEGMKTVAYEIWEQLGRVPDAMVLPVGHGTLLLGLYEGFRNLLETGLVDSMPALYGVQARNCSPLFEAFRLGIEEIPDYTPGPTVAEGISIAKPLRAKEILRAVRETGGGILVVEEEEILKARKELALEGFFVEPTSAVAVAALDHLHDLSGKTVVVPLTGSGLKSPG
ncbi:MAG: pyridoxal-phosphate dependent enzyme [Anaerolineae bacterium]|nr:pyridoxal-phosphate dependent enzyme [Anaerolineae bacterium]MDW8103136.1 pyridoxal-phosphate dependent enzyme [Anaerolineae bacterium]